MKGAVMSPVLTIVVANLKGGSTKTTTAAFVAHALAATCLLLSPPLHLRREE